MSPMNSLQPVNVQRSTHELRNARTSTMMKGSFSDLPEYYVAPPPLRAAPTPPSPFLTSSQALVPLPRPPPKLREDSHLSVNSAQSSKAEPRSTNSSRTSLSTVGRHRKHINIGIDFGTTFSGVSWAISGDAGVYTVENWPNSDRQVKVPTVLSYAGEKPLQWGYAIASGAERLSWFKLLLAEDHLPDDIKNSKHLVATKKLLKRLNKGVIDVTADYLGRLWDHALIEMRRQISSGMDGMPFRIVLGMPANWPQDAQKKMRDAAAQAGLLRRRAGGLDTILEFVAEPEAAAVAAFYEGRIQHDVHVGDTVVVCDAGGGTVDIVTYEVTRIQPSITLSEAISGDMGLCGSIFLDEGFMTYIEGLMGKEKFLKLSHETREELIDVWESKVKRQYHKERGEIVMRVPPPVTKAIDSSSKIKKVLRIGNSKKQLDKNMMQISAEDIVCIFDLVMSKILKLALKQRNEAVRRKSRDPKAILLVGGLGGNKFLYERLQEEFGLEHIDVLQPTGPHVWASICRGAAIKSMGYDSLNDDLPFPAVTSYISKAHYGMAFKEPFDNTKHTDKDRREYDEARDMHLAWDQMHWYVRKGDDVSKGEPVEMTWEFEQPENLNRRTYTITIFQCATDVAPTRKTDDVLECATITFTASATKSMIRDGFRVVRFDVRMSLRGMGKVDFATYVNGELAGQRDVRVDGSGR